MPASAVMVPALCVSGARDAPPVKRLIQSRWHYVNRYRAETETAGPALPPTETEAKKLDFPAVMVVSVKASRLPTAWLRGIGRFTLWAVTCCPPRLKLPSAGCIHNQR